MCPYRSLHRNISCLCVCVCLSCDCVGALCARDFEVRYFAHTPRNVYSVFFAAAALRYTMFVVAGVVVVAPKKAAKCGIIRQHCV